MSLRFKCHVPVVPPGPAMITSGWSRSAADGVITALARFLVRVFFSEVVVIGGAELPTTDPVVLVANHPSGLVDALVLMASADRFPRFLGKSTLWRVVPLRPFLALAGVVPVQRAVDTAAQLSDEQRHRANDEAFARCRRVLAAGGVVAVFPEGVSHDEPSLQGIRSGAARIAFAAASGDQVVGVQLVAAGLVYDDKARFRSRAMVRFLPARPIGVYVEEASTDEAGAIAHLVDVMAEDLRRAAPDFPSQAAAEELGYIADLISHRTGVAASLADRQIVAAALMRLVESDGGGGALSGLRRQVGAYRAALAALGLDDAAVADASTLDRPPRARYAAATLIGAAPIAAVGVAIHAVPYTVIKLVARLPRQQSMKATIKLLGSFGLYPLWYSALAWVAARRYGWRTGAVAFVVAPWSGWVALRSAERLARMDGIRRAAFTVANQRAAVADLVVQRGAIEAQTRSLLAMVR